MISVAKSRMPRPEGPTRSSPASAGALGLARAPQPPCIFTAVFSCRQRIARNARRCNHLRRELSRPRYAIYAQFMQPMHNACWLPGAKAKPRRRDVPMTLVFWATWPLGRSIKNNQLAKDQRARSSEPALPPAFRGPRCELPKSIPALQNNSEHFPAPRPLTAASLAATPSRPIPSAPAPRRNFFCAPQTERTRLVQSCAPRPALRPTARHRSPQRKRAYCGLPFGVTWRWQLREKAFWPGPDVRSFTLACATG